MSRPLLAPYRPSATPAQAPLAGNLADHLAAYGDRTALLGNGAGPGLTYADLAGRVRGFAARLGTTRRLVLVEGANHADALVAYLGAVEAGSPVLLTGPAAAPGLATAYDPDVSWDLVHGLREHRDAPAADLHEDLALLLSTSGTTGSPKLVRLSHTNVLANARAIVDYLELNEHDVAPTVLPMHYCYGLSVVHSHLLAGASLLLTEDSVVDASFWADVRRHGATSLAGVPYTFELLDRVGFADMELPQLRYLSQAGGRLAPEDVRRYARLGRERGWDLFVMYGQTEATARMAYLPPLLAETAPGTIGIPVAGGSFTIEPLPERPLAGPSAPEVGELVYHGPNVMLGYAESPADLALGRTVTELRTGDIGHQREDGLFEVVGRGLGVPEHHVRPVVDQLPDLGVRGPGERSLGQRLDGERAAGDGDADGAGRGLGEQRRQVGHPGGGLGLAVHDEELPAPHAPEAGVAAHVLGREPSPGLGEVAQVRQVQVGEPDPVEQLEGVGHAGQRGRPVPAEGSPERLVDHRVLGEQQARARQEVAVHDGQSVAVVHRQHRRRHVGRRELEVVDDRPRVGKHVGGGQPDQFGRAGGARGGQQHRELRVQDGGRLRPVLAQTPGQAPGHVGVVRRGEGRRGRGSGEQHRGAGLDRTEVRHQRVRVVGPLDEHQPAGGAKPGGERAHPAGQIGVRQAGAGPVAEQRDPVVVRRQVVRERPGERGGRRRRRKAAWRREAGGTGHGQDFIR